MHRLDEGQFRATFSLKMYDVEPDSAAMADILPCVRGIPTAHLQGLTFGELCVARVYRGDSGLFEHYLIPTTTANVFVVLVRDRVKHVFMGYHVLDLSERFGLPRPASGNTAAG